MTAKKGTKKNPSSPSKVQSKKLFYDTQNIVESQLPLFDNAKIKIDICINYYNLLSSSVVGFEAIKQSINKAKRRGIAIRYITEITKDNIQYCKELNKIVDEFRHLDKVKCNFILNESEYISIVNSFNSNKKQYTRIISEVIYSNIKPFIEDQQYFFDILWNKAIPAEKKIYEIENKTTAINIETPTQKILEEKGETIASYETKIFENSDEIKSKIIHLIETSSRLLIVSSSKEMQLIYNNFLNPYLNFLNKYKREENNEGIKWICNIEKENLELVKTFLKMSIQIRHVKNQPSVNFALGDSEINATIEEIKDGKMVLSLLTSNEPLYVKHFNSIFENLWYNSIDAVDRIKELEQDIESEGIQIIRDPVEVQRLIFDLLRSAKHEILIIFSTANAFHRQEKAGSVNVVKETVFSKGNNVNIKILTPFDNKLLKIQRELESLLINAEKEEQEGNREERSQQISKKIQIKFIESQSQTTVSILIVDRKYSLAAELKDDAKDTSFEAIGLATYSNSKSTVLSYVSMFETLWLQIELSDLLKIQDKIQKEFINVASHELRTPIQPILGLADILYSQIEDKEQRKFMEIIIRNANRLQRLTDDILDVAKIETGSLQIKKERFNLDELISTLLSQYKISVKEIEMEKVNMAYIAEEQNLSVKGDKGRLYQVLDNLLYNAIKFTKRIGENANINITTKRENNDTILISVKDNGTGIDKEILPRLFTKFATKSEDGTGLGLYISKNIIKAHNGKMWARNNSEEKGATFYFTLPISQ